MNCTNLLIRIFSSESLQTGKTATGTPDNLDEYYDDFINRCDYYGGCCNNGATGDIPDISAAEACCVCGGGIPEYSLCNNVLSSTVDGESYPWVDSQGNGCDWYGELHTFGDPNDNIDDDDEYDTDSRCFTLGENFENQGYTAGTACCTCGGGVHGVCKNYEGWKSIDSGDTGSLTYDCGWFEQTAEDEDPEKYDDGETRCMNLGWNIYNGENVTSDEACCVCGGGTRGLDYPSYMPIERPSYMPSLSPSDSPLSSSGPTRNPSNSSSSSPSNSPSSGPTRSPSNLSSGSPSNLSSGSPSNLPSTSLSKSPSNSPSETSSNLPAASPSNLPSLMPSIDPSPIPSVSPTNGPSAMPNKSDRVTETPSQSVAIIFSFSRAFTIGTALIISCLL